MKNVLEILSEARDKYTVHNCNECDYRKSCDMDFGSDGCAERRASIELAFGIQDNYFSDLLDRIEAAWKRERGNAAAMRERSNAAAKRERSNAAAMREALKAVVAVGYPHNFQREAPHIRGYCYDITKAIEKCFAALSAPPRNCDVGTAEEQAKRFALHCDKHPKCKGCPCCGVILFNKCEFVWAQMPYNEDVGKTDAEKTWKKDFVT